MENKVALVTGATSGIGLETARGLAREGLTVVLACRNLEKAASLVEAIIRESSSRDVVAMHLDLASLKSVKRFALEYGGRFDRLDILINNAGVFTDTRKSTENGFELTMGVNYLGHFLLTRLLMPQVLRTGGARIINVTSRAALFTKLKVGEELFSGHNTGFRAYALSKLAQIYFTIDLAEELAHTSITVNAAHPGRAATNIWQGEKSFNNYIARLIMRNSVSAREGARTSLYLSLSPQVAALSGKLFHEDKVIKYNRSCLDRTARKALIKSSFEALGSWASTC